jgi:hypothetical protein
VPIPAGDQTFVPPDATHYGDPPVDLTDIYIPTELYTVQACMQTQRYPSDGRIINTIDVSFTVPNVPGNHDILIDNYAFTHADPVQYLYERAYLLQSVIALPNQLPPFDYGAFSQPGPICTLDPVTVTGTPGNESIKWTGTVDPRGEPATATVEVTALGDADPTLVSPTYTVAASNFAEPLGDTLGPLDPGIYTVTLSANNGLAVSSSQARAVTIR